MNSLISSTRFRLCNHESLPTEYSLYKFKGKLLVFDNSFEIRTTFSPFSFLKSLHENKESQKSKMSITSYPEFEFTNRFAQVKFVGLMPDLVAMYS